ncbi:MAG: hypothetical protein KZQ97_22275 [Candidatus Thiodiazotropha sp. (ex Dulcina madagascariensis)]|nr:hypothetical protein [Candidatus Thiodiazotropha sp. (ex Dulcina madagascariensis)]
MSEELSIEYAKKILTTLNKLDVCVGGLDDLYTKLDGLSKSEIKRELKREIGEVMFVSYELVGLVVRQHPSLDPDLDSS